MRYYLGILVAVLIFAIPWMAYNFPDESRAILSSLENLGSQLAAVVIYHNPKTVADLQTRYNSSSPDVPSAPAKKVRILLVPGHEPNYGGAEYGSIKERNMTVELADDLQQFLGENSRYEVMVTRDTEKWDPVFANYFRNDWTDIQAWLTAHKQEITQMTRLGLYHPVASAVFHNDAPTDVALRLYGIDKWVDENDIDIVIHIHFNDYPGHGTYPGRYSGFTIYVPQDEYDNSSTTQVLADTVFRRLAKYNPVSNLPGESGGVVQDPDLIALGAFNSVDAASMLIEYGYIYEPQFVNDTLRSTAIKDLAFQTYLGLQDFFDPHNAVSVTGAAETLIMPRTWTNPISDATKTASEVFALQTALILDGDYPPSNRTLSDCPRSGALGPCTKTALREFQKKYGITGEQGMVGAKTLQQLNKLYSQSMN